VGDERMGIHWMKASVRVWDPKGHSVPDSDFLGKLTDLDSVTRRASRREWQSALVTLLTVERKSYADTAEGEQSFVSAIAKGFRVGGDWLLKQSTELFSALRDSEYKADLFIEAWIDSDQLSVELPVSIIEACSQHRLPITLYTND
jgi:hypothetical protein